MNLTLVRHGQAGTRLAYDQLSETGRRQAVLLGEHFRLTGAAVDASWLSGGLQRQRETGKLAAPHEPGILESWNEFDLDRVYHGIGPKLAAANSDFRRLWDADRAALERDGANEQSAVNRRWSGADEMVVRAWVSGSVDYDGESWQGFRARIRRALEETIAHASGQQSAVVFTSATPAAIAAGEALGLDEAGIFQLAGALLNASCTELRWRRGAWRLFSFNNVPHLSDRSLHTHR